MYMDYNCKDGNKTDDRGRRKIIEKKETERAKKQKPYINDVRNSNPLDEAIQ